MTTRRTKPVAGVVETLVAEAVARRTSVVWKAYLPVGPLCARVSRTDVAFFAARGVDREHLVGALVVLHLIRRGVLPLLRGLEESPGGLASFSFLVHDRSSGVPAPEGDDSPYLDLTLMFRQEVGREAFSRDLRFVRPMEEITEVAGVDIERMRGGAGRFQAVLSAQSAWYRMLLESYEEEMTDVDLLKQVGQHFHYFANMSQLTVG